MCPALPAQAPQPVQAGAEPFASDGGPVGVLVCHGFTGSPRSVRPWAERAVAELRDACEQVFVTGLSMGACLALRLYRSTVDHVVGPPSMKVLLAALPDAEVRPLENSFHVATLDNDAPTIFDGTLKFIKEHGYKD